MNFYPTYGEIVPYVSCALVPISYKGKKYRRGKFYTKRTEKCFPNLHILGEGKRKENLNFKNSFVKKIKKIKE